MAMHLLRIITVPGFPLDCACGDGACEGGQT